ncbi:MAG: acetylxylan esterase [Acidobacteria bacterium]|nr:acetylxylan esterase [Acidobacteriota bacterium]
MTRRELALVGGAVLAARKRAKAQSAPKYRSALDGMQEKVAMGDFDPIAYTLKLHDEAPLALTFRATGRREAEAWQKKLRPKIEELMGGFPKTRPPLESETLEVKEYPGYRREKFVFHSRPGVAVLGYLLTPKTGRAPHAPVVCIPGHGRGVDDIVGIDEKGQDRTVKVGYAYDYAVQVAEHGMAAVAIEPMSFGCRRDPKTIARNLEANVCQPTAGSALLLGQTMIGWRVYDIFRTIDWIEARPELDAGRVGCLGCSGGGMATQFAAALEPRIKAALVSSYLNTFRDCVMSISHCIDNYIPGILNWAEMYDVAGLIAPRPLWVESGERDTIFPVAASRASFARVKKMYEVFGAGDLTGQEVFDGPHGFSGKLGLPFMAKHLGVA